MAVSVRLMSTPAEEHELLLQSIEAGQRGSEPIRLLEAGCGHHWWLKVDGTPLHITGVDTDAAALRLRREQTGDLDEEILGDLRTVELPPNSFDVVYCSFVLEHVVGAERVLDAMADALRPGGRLIVRVPDGDSVYGFLTKRSPHRVHVWYKRYIEGKVHAGEPGHAPYPTVYEPVVSVRGLRQWCATRQLEIVEEYGTNFYLRVFRRLEPLASLAVRLIARLSGGRLSADHNNIGMVMVKPA